MAQRVLSQGARLIPAFSFMHLGGFFADPLISKSASLPAYRRNGLHRVSASCCILLLPHISAPFMVLHVSKTLVCSLGCPAARFSAPLLSLLVCASPS